ncbi:MAG TPA: DUF6089 family protein [Chryseosolibacter sp.]|nr:DUF6089 family protein [Chryseosolibacter sp.]
MRRILCLLIVCLVSSMGFEAYGQLNRKAIKKNNRRIGSFRGKKSHFGKDKIYNAVGISLNALNYFGDLAPTPSRFSTDIGFTRPAIGLSFSHRFGPRYTLTAAFTYGTLRGDDADSADPSDEENAIFRYDRNLSFRNRVKELSIVANFDLFENMATYISRVKWTPYAYLGIAVFHHNPQAQAPATDVNGNPLPEAGEWVDLQPLGTEGQFSDLDPSAVNHGIKPYKLIQPAIPMGLGVRFRINELMDFSAELGFRYLFTDYVDDVSGNYVNLDELNSELARAMSYRTGEVDGHATLAEGGVMSGGYVVWPGYGHEHRDNFRGNKDDRDIYMVTTFKLTSIIGKTFHRAKFR